MDSHLIFQQIGRCLRSDQHALRRDADALQRLEPTEREQARRQLRQRIEDSLAAVSMRRADLPHVSYPSDLPITAHRTPIIDALAKRQVLVVAGETGSGKSTQLPKIALEAGFGLQATIGHTQPRRIAARSVASRIAEELAVPLGEQVGFKVRFGDHTADRTLVKLMTDGILLAETQSDRFLEHYDLLILDEAHERSLNIDFLIAYLKQLLPRRPDMRLIVTSATIDCQRFSEHFADHHGPAPIIQVSGRSYPVEVRYRPLSEPRDGPPDTASESAEMRDPIDGVVDAVGELTAIDRGDILVFLPTEQDIREAVRRLRSTDQLPGGKAARDLLPLYARLPIKEQNRIFQPGKRQRIVLATNVAESSLTVPGIRYVVDTGTARISRYAAKSRVQRLPVEAVSQASADQRKGRCGREGPGICIRLYSEENYQNRDQYTTPEIRRTNLASVILQAKSLRFGDVEELPFLDPPRPEHLRDGYKTLLEIGAVDRHRRLTSIGKQIARLPVDPRVARMLLAAKQEGCLADVLVIAAALEIQDVRERPHDKKQVADERHAPLLDPDSDFVSYLKVWDFYHELRSTLSRSALRKACLHHFLSYNRLREWTEIHRQLQRTLGVTAVRDPDRELDYAGVHRSLLAGLLTGVAQLTGDQTYTGVGGLQLTLWPGSGLTKKRPKWIVAAELVETSRRFARTAARISPLWVEQVGSHLVKRTYGDPHWHRKSSTVMAFERVSFQGLPIVVGRRVPYGPIDPVSARQVFIEEGLVQRKFEPTEQVLHDNVRLLDDLAEKAAQQRRRDLLVDDWTVANFYDERLGQEVFDAASLRRWLRKDSAHVQALRMRTEDLVESDQTVGEAERAFPAVIDAGPVSLPLAYHFEVGADDDGVTVTVPDAVLRQLPPAPFDWLVPGLLEEKITALIRSLPKRLRRLLVPAPDTARAIAGEIPFGEGDFLTELASRLSRQAQQPIEPADFRVEKLSPHLRVNFRVIDAEGKTQQMGRDLLALQRAAPLVADNATSASESNAATAAPRSLNSAAEDALRQRWRRDDVTKWDFDELPPSITVERAGIQLPLYPCLEDRHTHCRLRIVDCPQWAEKASRFGLRRLFILQPGVPKGLKSQVRWLPHWNEIELHAHGLLNAQELSQQVQELIASIAFVPEQQALPRTLADFTRRLDEQVERISVATQEVAPLIRQLFVAYHEVRLVIEDLTEPRFQPTRQDVQRELSWLLRERFLSTVPWTWLQQYPRYLRAIVWRVDKLRAGGSQRDEQGREEIRQWSERCENLRTDNERVGRWDSQLETLAWMIQELRVSWYAQPLGTSVKVSPRRIEKLWQTITAGNRSTPVR